VVRKRIKYPVGLKTAATYSLTGLISKILNVISPLKITIIDYISRNEPKNTPVHLPRGYICFRPTLKVNMGVQKQLNNCSLTPLSKG
jgi:hypothetical protein